VDECHRGSARDNSNWREILEYFEPAFQLGMTATPRRQDNADTYNYFGEPIYTYSLRQGIDDGFLAPYRVHRVVTTWDAAGWRPRRSGSVRPRDSRRRIPYSLEIEPQAQTSPGIFALRSDLHAPSTLSNGPFLAHARTCTDCNSAWASVTGLLPSGLGRIIAQR
jgi:superfamily II DNA or RNA helicase